MATIPPIVRQMLVCEDVQPAGPDRRHNVLGLIHAIRAKPGQSFPLRYPSLCVYLVLTGGVGTGRLQIRVVEADTDAELIVTPELEVNYSPDRHLVSGALLRITDCVFPRPGLYWVEFYHDGLLLRRQPVTAR